MPRPHLIAAAIVYQHEAAGLCAGYPPEHTCPDKALPTVAGRCRACQDAWNRHRHAMREERKAAGLCTNCGEGDVRTRSGRVLCHACQERHTARRARTRTAAREERLWALLRGLDATDTHAGTSSARRLRLVAWLLRQLGYTVDFATYPRLASAMLGRPRMPTALGVYTSAAAMDRAGVL